MMLVVDNYDSFTYNLVQALGELGAELEVCRNDEVDVDSVRVKAPEGIVLSPGPGHPKDAGICCKIVEGMGSEVPILGVCLGHQVVAAAFGGVVARAPEIVHGKTAKVEHCEEGLFKGLPQQLEVARYHSLIVERSSLPESLEITAATADGLIMGVRHHQWALHGVQFHPESIATPDGPTILENFLLMCAELEP